MRPSLTRRRVIRFAKILIHNLAQSTEAYEKLVGDSVGAAAAEASVAQMEGGLARAYMIQSNST